MEPGTTSNGTHFCDNAASYNNEWYHFNYYKMLVTITYNENPRIRSDNFPCYSGLVLNPMRPGSGGGGLRGPDDQIQKPLIL